MKRTELRDVVDEHWSALEIQQSSSPHSFRVSELPVDTTAGPLAAAVDNEGYRHLLIPVGPHQSVRSGLNGPVLILRKRALEDENTFQGYADLGCMRPDVNDIFTGLCADVLVAAERMPAVPLKALYAVLDRWKALFLTRGTPLSAEKLSGLYGELTVLERLLQIDPSAHRLWTGPSGHRHDFTSARFAVEVKTSTATDGRRVRIHGLDQLEYPAGGDLLLVCFRLIAGRGRPINELAAQTVALSDDESTTIVLLAQGGYRTVDSVGYQDVRFEIAEERWYVVDAAFPKLSGHDLVTAGIPINVIDVEYTVDLSNEPPEPLGSGQVNSHLAAMITESA